MSLHNDIMNLMCDNSDTFGKDPMLTYKLGHRDARHAAAELAIASDAEIERLQALSDERLSQLLNMDKLVMSIQDQRDKLLNELEDILHFSRVENSKLRKQ